jgi:cobyrinic acid a,c-diamide synthase
MNRFFPRIVVAAMRGGAGKTTLSLGMAAAWRKRGRKVRAFKKGPDYIDAAWLSLASGRPCHNLDTFLMGRRGAVRSFVKSAAASGFSLIEGNRGLYDGVDAEGTQSTAELAKLLDAPVVLIVDCGKMTRTAAALVLGCRHLDPAVDIRGVILNRVARSRQEKIIRTAIEDSCDLPVLGAVPRVPDLSFPERHLGLIPPQEHSRVEEALLQAAEMAEAHLDLDQLGQIAMNARPLDTEDEEEFPHRGKREIKIGVIRDAAFQFYYPENLEALAERGATVVEISALQESRLPDVDALYIGGGFPETHAAILAGNEPFRRSLREAAEGGLPIYAECGGLMYLGESLRVAERTYPMAGVLPMGFAMDGRPQEHGYTVMEVERENPFFPVGEVFRGHEFHYSRVLWMDTTKTELICKVLRGAGIDGQRDGVCLRNVFGAYTHIHAAAHPRWADALVENAARFHARKAAAWEAV